MTDSSTSPPLSDSLGLKAYLALIAIAIGYILNPINGTLVMTAYPHLAQVFEVPYAHMSAMVMFFMAATAAAQPLAGGLGDSLGRKNLFLLGIAGFTAASTMAALAENFTSLLSWRIAQAVFSGVILANALGLVGQVVPASKRGRYLGMLNATMVASSALSFPLGGLLVQHFEWPILFWLNLPLGLTGFILAWLCLPKDLSQTVSLTAVSLMGLPFLPLAFGLQAFVKGEALWPSGVVFVLTLVLVVISVWRSHQSRRQFSRINNWGFNSGCAVAYFSAAIQFGIMFTLPAWSLVALNINSATLGLYLAGFSLTMFLVSPVIGKLLDQHGSGKIKWLVVASLCPGLLLLILGLNTVSFALVAVLIGSGIAVALLTSQRAAMLATPSDSQALAMGMFSSWRSVGGLSGNALAAIVLARYPQVVPQAGVDVFVWLLMAFFIPLVITLYCLQDASSEKPVEEVLASQPLGGGKSESG